MMDGVIAIAAALPVAGIAVRHWRQARRQDAAEEAELMDRIAHGIEQMEQRHREASRALDALIVGRRGDTEPADGDAPLVVTWEDDDGTWQQHDTGLRAVVMDGAHVVAFSTHENAVDCLRIVTEAVRREDTDAPTD